MNLLKFLPILLLIFTSKAMAKTSNKSLDQLMDSSIEVCIDLEYDDACSIVAIDQDTQEVFTFITDNDKDLVERSMQMSLNGITTSISQEEYNHYLHQIPNSHRYLRDINEVAPPVLLKAVTTCDYMSMACLAAGIFNPFIGFSCGLHQILICTEW